MKRASCLLALLLATGCEKFQSNGANTPATPAVAPTATVVSETQVQTPEEFEGMVELFDVWVRARRHVKLDAEGNYVKDGKATAWYESGQKAGEMWFRDNKPHGVQHVWHENGLKKMHGQSEDGLAVGTWIEWHENGQKKSTGNYVQGQRHGLWNYWDEEGRKIETAEYDHGQRVRFAATPSGTLSR